MWLAWEADSWRVASPLSVNFDKITCETAAWRILSTSYIICDDDRAVHVSAQEAYVENIRAANKNIREHRLPSSHSPFLSMPGEVAKIIKEAVDTRQMQRFILLLLILLGPLAAHEAIEEVERALALVLGDGVARPVNLHEAKALRSANVAVVGARRVLELVDGCFVKRLLARPVESIGPRPALLVTISTRKKGLPTCCPAGCR